MAILAVIEVERLDRGMTQEALARAAGISQSSVSRILSGVAPVTLPELLPICEALGLSLSEVARRASA